jgi:nucleotide-binding universal stress UspA family protein
MRRDSSRGGVARAGGLVSRAKEGAMETVVVGVEDSERSGDALALARRLADPSALLLLVCVYQGDAVYAGEGGQAYPQALRADAERTLVRLSGSPGIATRAVAAGHPAWGLQEVAAEQRAALIVVGSSHACALRRILPGSTGERLLHGAPCPVAIAPRGYGEHADAAIATVGCAYDGSAEALGALAMAEDVARRLGARLDVMRVVEPHEDAAAADDLARVVAQLDPAVCARSLVLRGEPVHELATASSSVDLLVAGSRGYGPMHAVLTGATSGRLIRKAACPAVIVARGTGATIRGNPRQGVVVKPDGVAPRG